MSRHRPTILAKTHTPCSGRAQLSEAIREARERRGGTLDQVAQRIPRMDAKYLGEIERGWRSSTIPRAKRIADALETRLSDLLNSL
jgi:transcriptional regulator with XRE-family HTH domain